MRYDQRPDELLQVTRQLDRIRTLKRVIDRFFLATGYLAGMLFTLLAFFITYDVMARKWGYWLGLPTTRVTDEISGYLMALAVTWGFAYTLRTEGHVRIDVLLPYFSPRWRRVVDLLAMWSTGFLACLFAWKVWLLVIDSWETGMRSSTYLLTPLWIPQGILGVGFTLLAIAAVFTPIYDIVETAVLRRQRLLSADRGARSGLENPPAHGAGGSVTLRPE